MNIKKGVVSTPLKICIYGTEGIGKTTLASHAPSPLFIDIENGSNQLDVARTEPAPTNWKELLSQVEYVSNNPDLCDTLIIDTADAAENLCIEYICEREKKASLGSFGYGTGYQFLAEEFKKLLDKLDKCIDQGINVIVIAHSQLRKFEQPEENGAYDRYELKLQKKTSPLVKEWCDGLFFCNYKTIVETINGTRKAYGGDRVIYTTHHPAWDAKNRFGLSEELPLKPDSLAGLLPRKNEEPRNEEYKMEITDDFSLLEDDDFMLVDDDLSSDKDVPIMTVPEVIRSRIKGTGVGEKQVIEAIMKTGQTPKGLTIGEDPVLENFNEEWLENNVLARFDGFIEFVKTTM